MGQRSRKRGRRERPATPVAATTPPQQASRPPDRRGQGRSEQRNAAVRATLRPIEPGERPWALKIAVVLAVLVGAGDLIDVLFGGTLKFGHSKAGIGGVVLFSVMMLACAWGMWKLRYWAVLGFQAILAIVVLIFSLLLIRANNVLGLVVGLAVVGGGGFLFYKLVRVLSRLQMPEYPGR